MKSITQATHLHFYRKAAHSSIPVKGFFTVKQLDGAVMIVSLAGLFSAFVFLATMS